VRASFERSSMRCEKGKWDFRTPTPEERAGGGTLEATFLFRREGKSPRREKKPLLPALFLYPDLERRDMTSRLREWGGAVGRVDAKRGALIGKREKLSSRK